MTSKNKFKGFTLVELIAVMAVFGIIMLGAMQLLDPVGRMMKGASLQESNNAAVDNVKRYFEGTLRCANAMDVHEGELPAPLSGSSASTPEEQAVIDFVDKYYKNRADSNDDPVRLKVNLMKIDNSDHGKIKESTYDVTAGYTYKTTDDGGVTWEYKDGNEVAPEIHTASTVPYHEVINNVFYKDYSMFITLGYSEMSAVNVKVPEILKKDHNYGRLNKIKDYYFGNSSRDSSSKSLFSFTFTTYKNGNAKDGLPYYREVTHMVENEDGSKSEKTEDLFLSPYASSNASLALVNINSAFGDKYRSSLDFCPERHQNSSGTISVYKTMVYDEDEGKEVERTNYIDNIEKNIGAYFEYKKHETDDADGNKVIDGDNIYIVYTIPET